MIFRNWLGKIFHKDTRSGKSSNIKDTKTLFSKGDGAYLSGRRVLHQKILADLQNTYQGSELNPQAIFFGGGSGTGKSVLRETIAKSNPQLLSRVVQVDPDEIKLYIPEYQIYKEKYPQKAALLVHKESCDIRDELVNQLIRKRRSFIYESTMAKPKKYKSLFTNLKKAGYDIHLYIADASLSLARKRAGERARKDGRVVPDKVIVNTHKLVPSTFFQVRDLADNYYIFNTEKGKKLVMSCTVKDFKMLEVFLKKN
ncbi:zeta toxin family protein [Cytobacillus firmus]|nr:zeta toxin family protein [Cytobacillus firmus]